jgi:hypothetical protein
MNTTSVSTISYIPHHIRQPTCNSRNNIRPNSPSRLHISRSLHIPYTDTETQENRKQRHQRNPPWRPPNLQLHRQTLIEDSLKRPLVPEPPVVIHVVVPEHPVGVCAVSFIKLCQDAFISGSQGGTDVGIFFGNALGTGCRLVDRSHDAIMLPDIFRIPSRIWGRIKASILGL